jgi:uncharacterized membrane protein
LLWDKNEPPYVGYYNSQRMTATIVISGREWLLPAAGFLFVAVLLLVWTYLRAHADRKFRTTCAFLKLLGLAALLACLLDPLWSSQKAKPGANFFAIVADNSQGLGIKDRGETMTRGQSLTNLLAPEPDNWQDKLENNFQVRRYIFDSRLQSAKDFSELTFAGQASAIGAALRTIGERFRGQPFAGVLLLTDGNATDLPEGKLDTPGLPPIYPVIIGRDDIINDVAVQKVSVSQTAFEDQPVTVQAEVLANGYTGRMMTAQLLDQNGKVVQELNQRATRETDTFRFQLRPDKTGVSFYQVRAAAKDELSQFTPGERSTEATLANNSRVVTVDRGKGPYRILYVSGRPNWEFKFLNRALAEDEQVELVGLIRIAKKEKGFGQFEFRSRPGESANPLFRGFDRTSEDTEGYDEPVLIRLNTKDATELAGGFPKTADVLFGYHAVILDDLEAEFFTRDQMSLLQKFVSERGGGLLMLGGAESFQQGKFAHTPVGEMLPVYLDFDAGSRRGNEADPAASFASPPPHVGDYRLNLTREGWLQPWARLRDNEMSERARLTEMPALQVLNRVRDKKPGASVIAEVQDESGAKFPALVEQRFGNGRVGAVLVGDLWRSGLRDEAAQADLGKAWRQMLRWLIADVPERIQLTAGPKRDDANQAMALRVRVRDKEFKAVENAEVKITVTTVGETNSVRVNAEPMLTEAGVYEAQYVPRMSGGFLANAVVTDENGVEQGSTQAGWTADPAAEEFRSLRPNRALLENLARQTGGAVLAPDDLMAFVEKLPKLNAPITETVTTPLWHKPPVFLLALACFAAEWGLRRWKGMA